MEERASQFEGVMDKIHKEFNAFAQGIGEKMKINKTSSQMLDELLENLFNVAGHHPEAEFIKDFVSEQRENKVLSDSEIYQQCVNHLVRQSRLTHLLHITELKRKISSGIEELSRYNEWPSLSAIAFHAMEEHVKCLKKESSEGCVVSRNMLSGSQLRLRALESNNSEIQKLFKNYKI